MRHTFGLLIIALGLVLLGTHDSVRAFAALGDVLPQGGPRQLNLSPGETGRVRCSTTVELSGSAPEWGVRCLPPTPPPTVPPTATLPPTETPPPSATPVPPTEVPPTNTPMPPPPTMTPHPLTPTPPPAAFIEGVPVCQVHSNTRWHGLVERNAAGAILCTYGHEHHDDPRPLDSVFGVLPWGEISYPWETPNENATKHASYKWATMANPTCAPMHSPAGNPNGLTLRYGRMLAHNDGNSGALTRFHSLYMQTIWCYPGGGAPDGRYDAGGWMDYGVLFARNTDTDFVHIPLPADAQPPALTGDPFNSINRRVHNSPLYPNFSTLATWYGGNRALSVGIGNENWGPLDPARPNNPPLFYDVGLYNGSRQAVFHLVGLHTEFEQVPPGAYTTRHGHLTQGCTGIGLDCVPFRKENMPLGVLLQFRWEQQFPDPAGEREYDVMSPVTGNSLITYPN